MVKIRSIIVDEIVVSLVASLKRYCHAIWDKKFIFNIRVDY